MAGTTILYPQDFLLSEQQAATAGKGLFEPKSLMVKIKPSVAVDVEVNERVKQVVQAVMKETLDREAKELVKAVSGVIDMFLKKDASDVEGAREAVNRIVDGSAAAIERLLDKAVKEALAKEAKQDTLLLEAKVKVALKAVACAAKLTTNALRIAATGGADVHAWYSLASTIKDIADLAIESLKTEAEKLKEFVKERDELESDFDKLTKARNEAEKAEGLSAVFPTLKKAGLWVLWKKQCGKTEESRVKYRNAVFATRKEIDLIAEPIKKLEPALKTAPSLKAGIAIGAKLMALKGAVRRAIAAYNKKLEELEAIAKDLKALGAEIDDRTLVEKFKAIPKLLKSKNFSELASTSKDCYEALNEVKEACKEIKELVSTIVELAK